MRSFDDKALRAHHARHYTAKASVLAFSGGVEPDRVFETAARTFGALPGGEAIAAEAPVHTQKKPRVRVVENQSSQTELRVCLRAVAESSPERAATEMLMRIIDDGMSTRLYHRICDAQGLCYDVSAGFDGYEDDGVIDFAAGVQHARTARVTGEILGLLEELANEGPTADELAKARRRNAWDMRAMLDSAEDLASTFATGLLFDRFLTPAQRLAQNDAVTRDEIREMARRLARPERLNVLAVGLLENGESRRLSETVKSWQGAR